MPNITLDLGSGRGVVADKFFEKISNRDDSKPNAFDTRVPLPMFGETHLEVPPFFIVASKKKGKGRNGIKWRLANPLTEIRNLASRKGKNSITLTRNEDAESPAFVNTDKDFPPEKKPLLYEFSKRDQAKIIKHFRSIYDGEAEDRAIPTTNKPRGFPAVLYKNAKKAGYKETKNKVYRKNDLKPKSTAPLKYPAGRPRKGRKLLVEQEGSDDEDFEDGGLRGEPSAREKKRLEEEKKAREKKKNARPMDESDIRLLSGLYGFYGEIIANLRYKRGNEDDTDKMVKRLKEMKAEGHRDDEREIDKIIKEVMKFRNASLSETPNLLPPDYKQEWEAVEEGIKKATSVRDTAFSIRNRLREEPKSVAEHKALLKEAKKFMDENPAQKKFYDLEEEFNKSLKEYAKIKGRGFESDIDAEGDKDGQDGGCDGEGSGGGILGDIGKKISKTAKKVYKKITNPKQTLQEVKKFGKNLIYGRLDAYPPSVQKIIDANKDAIVQSITLHRKPLSSTYTTLMSWATGGETDKRLKEQPKDTLYHISMWVKLSNGKTLKVEKNEVIAINPNPKAHKDEQTQEVPPPPAGLTFGDMLEKARKEAGDTKFFGYSAKDNNCGNFIEYILRANGMESEQTKDYIGQDTKTILAGFPTLRKVMNTITDIAGRANVLLEGGDLGKAEEKLSHDSNIDMPSQGGRMLGATHSSVFPAHAGHPALASDMFPRIPQAFSQVYLSHPRPIGGEGLYAGGGLYAQGSSGRGSYPARKIAPVNRGTPMEGDGFFDDIGDAFKFTFSKKGGRAIKEGLRPVGTFLTRTALPSLVSGLTGFGTTLLTGNPVAGFAVGQTAGKALGKLAGNALGDATGTGMKKPRMVKGSAEAKAYMASIRKKKGMKGGELPPRSRSVITDPSLLGQGLY